MAEKENRISTFFKQKNWLISAGLVIMIYLAGLITLDYYHVETTYLKKMLLALPLIAVLMVVVGIFEKKRKEEDDRIRKKKRYEATLEIDRFQRKYGAGKGKQPTDTDKNKGD